MKSPINKIRKIISMDISTFYTTPQSFCKIWYMPTEAFKINYVNLVI